tara:strand:- start:507 stop:758 length:252 start_codon:yes stop_codon:yes gene_type:complete
MRSPFGEIDLIMKRGRRLVFVEEKFRTDKGISEQSLPNHWQRQQIERSAIWFQGRYLRLANCNPAIEVFVISNWRSFRYIPAY